MALSVALQLYTVRDDMAADFAGTLAKVKAMGYEGVEFAGLFGHSAAEVKKMCEETGLTPISAHVPYRDILKDPRGVLSAYAKIGCKYVAIPYLIPEDRPGSEKFGEVIQNAKLIGAVARELGMVLLYHNHDFEFEKIDGKYALEVLYDTVPAELLQTELDTCWVNVGGEEPASYVRKYSGRAPVVHLKDFVGQKNENMYELIGIESEKKETAVPFEFRPVGYGCQNMPAIVKAAEDSDAVWLVVEQDRPSMGLTALECAAKSREYLKSIGH
ncbi:MAG: sugar phosphate isomerase/epimerase [Clostridia bacterium]|nr:sugar phosphate isomerase/epimerase [Clostridia bacterium]MBQ9162783.1 sugar phosphate isomerase/epimerase [Clostridia bacterium]